MKTLIIIDCQYDFLPGGNLPVPDGDTIMPVINRIITHFDLVLATQDWHPAEHKSFASNHFGRKPFDRLVLHNNLQTLWPDHCIQGTHGAEIESRIDSVRIAAIIRKGMDPEVDSYSAFYDNNQQVSTGLAGYLKEKEVTEIHFCGLAGDICVYYSILDALTEGFSVVLIEDASKPLLPEKFDDVKCELAKLGVRIISSEELLQEV
jgi:nicotinamidase/pyrazinamidase